MRRNRNQLRAGDIVEVKSPRELLQTLDADGALDGLPFMPEMVAFCGRRLRVSQRVVKTCVSGSSSTMRGFRGDDVVILEGLRCSGAMHDGCQKGCMIFWREQWLRRVDDIAPQPPANAEGRAELQARLQVSAGADRYFCQASEILKATEPLSRRQRFMNCFRDVRAGNCTSLEMVQRIGVWLFWRARRKVLGECAQGNRKLTPVESLNLEAGEWVEVKPMESIIETLNQQARNRGLYFSPDMRLLCGRRQRVERKVEKIIVDGTGEMRQLENTVFLEGSSCGCAHVAFGGCPRGEFSYWREIWLRRSKAAASQKEVPAAKAS